MSNAGGLGPRDKVQQVAQRMQEAHAMLEGLIEGHVGEQVSLVQHSSRLCTERAQWIIHRAFGATQHSVGVMQQLEVALEALQGQQLGSEFATHLQGSTLHDFAHMEGVEALVGVSKGHLADLQAQAQSVEAEHGNMEQAVAVCLNAARTLRTPPRLVLDDEGDGRSGTRVRVQQVRTYGQLYNAVWQEVGGVSEALRMALQTVRRTKEHLVQVDRDMDATMQGLQVAVEDMANLVVWYNAFLRGFEPLKGEIRRRQAAQRHHREVVRLMRQQLEAMWQTEQEQRVYFFEQFGRFLPQDMYPELLDEPQAYRIFRDEGGEQEEGEEDREDGEEEDGEGEGEDEEDGEKHTN